MADKPNITKDGYVAQLVQTGFWATPQNPIQYAFLEQKPAYLPNEPGFAVFSPAQRTAVQKAFAVISEVVNLTFVQVADNQQIPGPGNPRIAFYANTVELSYSGSMYAHRVQEGPAIHGADIRFNSSRIAQRQTNEGWQDFTSFVALHEVLHAMGLSHPGNYNGQGPIYQTHAEFVEDTVQYSVMSYFGAANTGADHTIGNVLYGGRTPLLYDILALQSLYSPNMTTRAGDTVYGFNSNTGANSPFNFAVTPGPVVAIWDGGGIDTIDLSGYSGGSLIDLNEGAFSDAGGLTKNIAIAFNVTIENAVGGAGGDRLVGNAAANRLDGGAGADLMEGGPGEDLYLVDDPGDAVVELGSADRDEVRTALATYVLPGNVEVLTGTSAAGQTLIGNSWANTVTGGAGDDTLVGGPANDALVGGAGNGDTAVYSGNRADYEILTTGGITIRDTNAADGDDGTDSLSGVEFARFADSVTQLGVDTNNPPELGLPGMVDQIWADGQAATYKVPPTAFFDQNSQDTLALSASLSDGSALPAWLSFDASTRTFSGTPPVAAIGATLAVRVTAHDGKASVSDDFTIGVTQAPGADVNGTDGADLLEGTFRAERMFGHDGDDVLRGSAGADILHGVAGTDQADYSASPAGVTVNLAAGTGSGGHAEGDQLVAIEGVTGSSHSDRLIGTPGNDVIDGGAGADSMEGGAGADLYFVDDPADAVVELVNGGVDEVRTSLSSHGLAADVERLIGLSNTGQALSGNALANVIVGAGGNDTLDGGAGADQLAGGLGNDVYFVDAADSIVESAFGGSDEVRTAMFAYTLAAELENLTGLSPSGQLLIGNGSANEIRGSTGADVLDGAAGDDRMIGGSGDDLYFVNDGGDLVEEQPGAGADEVRTTLAAYSLAANVEILIGTVATGQSLTGNNLANVIKGAGGSDLLDGLGGGDWLEGGVGDDVYVIDNLGDSITEWVDEGIDEVRTIFAAASLLGSHVENLTASSDIERDFQGSAGDNAVRGGGGNDLLRLYDGGNDGAYGGGGNDVILFGAAMSWTDFVDGGEGLDQLVLQGNYVNGAALLFGGGVVSIEQLAILSGDPGANFYDYKLTLLDATVAAGAQMVVDAGGLRAGEELSFDGSAETSARFEVLGGAGADLIITGAGDDVLDGGGGADTLAGGFGDDEYIVDNAGDVVAENSGEGADRVVTTLAAYSLLGSQVENLLADDNFNHDFRGSAGNNAIAGGGGSDFLRLYDGGNDSAFGGAGNDVILFGGAMSWTDFVDGGEGLDQLVLQGHYVGGSALLFGGGVVGIENIAILPGDDTRFGDPGTNLYDYQLTLQDATVAPGVQAVIDANRLRAGEDLTFDGSAELDGSFFVYGGGGTDILFGGANNDVFLFGAWGQWNPGDVVVGGSGIDQLALRGNYSLTFGAGQLYGIENIGLLSAHDTRFGALGSSYSYDLTMVDGNVASGLQMTVDGAKLRVAEFFRFDGSAELDGSFRVFGGLVDDTIIASRNNDFLQGNGGSDTLTGGDGADIFRYLATSDSTAGAADRILDFTPGTDKIDLSRIDANSHSAGDQAFSWVGSNAFTGTGAASAGELRAYQSGASWFVEGDTDGNGSADLRIDLTLAGPTPLASGDFTL
jgi:serralysin